MERAGSAVTLHRLGWLVGLLAGCHHHAAAPFVSLDPACPVAAARLDVPLFHGDRARLGWSSSASNRPNTPVVAHGFVFVGTDRIEAYGLRP